MSNRRTLIKDTAPPASEEYAALFDEAARLLGKITDTADWRYDASCLVRDLTAALRASEASREKAERELADAREVPPKLSEQIKFLREAFRNDGAEGETIWAVAAAAERALAYMKARDDEYAAKLDAREADFARERKVHEEAKRVIRAVVVMCSNAERGVGHGGDTHDPNSILQADTAHRGGTL